MNILVILRAVRDPQSFVVNRKAQKVFVNREQFSANPSDRNALEAALRLNADGGSLTVAAVGPGPAETLLRDARAAGATRALWVKDKALKDADPLVLTGVFKAIVARLGEIDLILCGAEAVADDSAQVAPRLAQALDWPFIAAAQQVAVEGALVTAIVARGRGFHKFAADWPAVVSVAPDSNKPRLAPGRRLVNIYNDAAAVEVITTSDLGLSAEAITPVTEARGESFPPERELGRRLTGDLAAQLADLIHKA